MANAKANTTGGKRASRTRAEIIAAAEMLFSTKGYAATRLDDVADEVGLSRASLFYHFKDKQALFDATIANAFGSLDHELHALLDSTDHSISERIALAVEVWIDAVINSPNLAKLILRFVVDDDTEQGASKIYSDDNLVPQKFFSLFEEGMRTGELKPLHEDPFHVASAIIGTTVFYVSALSKLIPDSQTTQPSAGQLEAYKQEALNAAIKLLGIKKIRAKKSASAASPVT